MKGIKKIEKIFRALSLSAAVLTQQKEEQTAIGKPGNVYRNHIPLKTIGKIIRKGNLNSVKEKEQQSHCHQPVFLFQVKTQIAYKNGQYTEGRIIRV